MAALLVCRKCFRSIGKKDGWKRASVMKQLEDIALRADGADLAMSGCLGICKKGTVAFATSGSKKKHGDATGGTVKPNRDDKHVTQQPSTES